MGRRSEPIRNAAHDALEKHRWAQAKKGLPLEASPITEDDDNDDDDEGMEVRLGFSPEARLWSTPASAGPYGGAKVLASGMTASRSEARASSEPGPLPFVAEEAMVVEEVIAGLP